MNTVQQQWEVFSSMVIANDASPVQRQEMRRAFYAGSEAMMRIQWAIGGAEISEDEGIQILEGCQDELKRFADQVAQGKA